MNRTSLVLVAVLALAGCSKKESADGGGGGGGAAPAAVALPKLGLVLDAPGKVKVEDGVLGDGHMIMGSKIGAMQVEAVEKAVTLDEAKADADMYSPKNLVTETLADGWVMTFENTGSMGANSWVDVRRTIDGKTYKCTSTGPKDTSNPKGVVEACKSLRKQ